MDSNNIVGWDSYVSSSHSHNIFKSTLQFLATDNEMHRTLVYKNNLMKSRISIENEKGGIEHTVSQVLQAEAPK